MQGASALQTILDQTSDLGVKTLVGWEPVMKSDLGPPSASVQSRVSEPSAYRFWDPQHLVSKAILSWAKAQAEAPHEEWEMLDEDEVAWDCILVFPPGARWENEFPKPSFIGFPVVDQISQSVAALKAHQKKPSSIEP